MAVIEGLWSGRPVSVTDGTTQVQFGTPGDFADWLEELPVGTSLAKWRWITEPVLSDN
jgi:hypothetical protein